MKFEPKYQFFKAIIHIVLKSYYRSVETYGLSFVPKQRTLMIANHQSGLADGLLIIASAPGMVRPVAKHTLWNNWVIGTFASGLGMIPVYRRQDLDAEGKAANDATTRNDKTFHRVESTLIEGDNVLIFPEGVSHDNPHILPLRSGAARMLLQTEAKFQFKLDLKWLPVSIDFDRKDKPGSRVHVHYHPPRGTAEYHAQYLVDPDGAIEALRTEMQVYLTQVTVNFKTWKDRAFVEKLTEIWLARTPSDLLRDRQNQLLKWKRIFESTGTENEDRLAWNRLRYRVNAVYNSLRLAGLEPNEVFDRQSEGRKRALAKLFSATMFWAPIILFGLCYYWVPTMVVKLITKKGAGTDRDVVSTYQIVAAVVFYPIWIVVTLIAAGTILNFWFMLACLGIILASGISLAVAVHYLRIEFIEVLNMFRYKRLEDRLDFLENEIRLVWAQAAKLWNLALKRQAAIERDQ